MRRRRLLTGAAAAATGSLTGCIGRFLGDDDRSTGPPEGTDVIRGDDGTPADVCTRESRPERIPAIVEPAFAPDWRDLDRPAALRHDTAVIGLERGGEARAYPVTAMRLEIVNDTFGGPILVTYCPLCSSGLVAVRKVAGQTTVFDNTSLVWRPPGGAADRAIEEERVFGFDARRGGSAVPTVDPNLVMVDRATGSFWSQLLASAICGPRTGDVLELLPSTVTTWGAWRDRHPDTMVLLPPPYSRTVLG